MKYIREFDYKERNVRVSNEYLEYDGKNYRREQTNVQTSGSGIINQTKIKVKWFNNEDNVKAIEFHKLNSIYKSMKH